MFTWICPDCGREVPPSYTDCPDCADKAKNPAPVTEAPAAPETRPLPESKPLPAPAAPPTPYLRLPKSIPEAPPVAAARTGPPTWLMSILFALAFVGIGAGAFLAIQYFKKESGPAAKTSATMESPGQAPAAGGKAHPLLKQIEVVGLRLTQNRAKKTEVRFLVVNHSGAEIQDLAGTVNLQGRTAKKDEEPVGAFSFKIPMLGPYESKEINALVDTKLKVYELPDWQNLDQQLQITAP